MEVAIFDFLVLQRQLEEAMSSSEGRGQPVETHTADCSDLLKGSSRPFRANNEH